MKLIVRVIVGLALGTLSACTTTKQVADSGFIPPSGDYRLIVMQPDIKVGQLTAGGMVENREDWSIQARDNVLNALVAQQATRGGLTKIAASASDIQLNPETTHELVRLHQAVGSSIQLHKYVPAFQLPSKKGTFDWTLGEAAVQLGRASNADYALFVHAEDSFSSGGRVALQVAGWLTCAVGVCVGVTGGQQVAFVSLVDLKTGRVAWFNFLASSVGDIRTADGARKMVDSLLGKMKPGSATKK